MPSRSLLPLVVLLVACAHPRPDSPAPTASPTVYIGGFRPEIAVYKLDLDTAVLTPLSKVAEPPASPSFMAFAPSRRFAYAVDEVDNGRVVSFSVDQQTGALTRLNDASASGFGPTYISLDRTGRWAMTASWAKDKPASISVNPIGEDGKVGEPVDVKTFAVNGHGHYITTDPSNRFVIASISGSDFLAQYRFDAATGKLTPNTPDRVLRPTGANPRHFDFHPNGKYAYLINEHSCTVTAYQWNGDSGTLTEIQDITTLPAGYTTPENTTAQILVHRSGNFLYGSNRGHDSVVTYRIDPASGKLSLVGFTKVGRRPRNFNMDPSGRYLFVASQDDGTVTAYEIDQTSGVLTQKGLPQPAGDKPTFVGFLLLPR
jgi:6-phosphogluconolactonase